MKNKSLKITILLTAVFFLFVENSVKAQTEFGVKGGVLFSGITKNYNSTVFDFEKRTGFAAGIFLKRNNLFGPVGIQTELLYQLKGGDFFIMQPSTSSSFPSGGYYGGYGYFNKSTVPWLRRNEKYHYLNLPLLITFSPLRFLDVFAGPEAGFLISTSKSSVYGDDVKQFSAGITAGFALKICDDTRLDLRYSEDFTQLYNFGDSDFKNNGFTVSLQKTLFKSAK